MFSAAFRIFITFISLTFPLTLQAGNAKELNFFRIGIGSLNGVYAPIAAVVTDAISNPPGMRECKIGGKCGVPGLIAIARSTHNSAEAIESMRENILDSAFVQADVLYWAYRATKTFKDKKALDDLRVLTSLYSQSLHIVVNKWADIKSIEELKGRIVSIGEKGSDTYLESQFLLNAFNINEQQINARYLNKMDAVTELQAGRIDAFITLSGFPSRQLQSLAEENLIDILPLKGPEVKKLSEANPFLKRTFIPQNTYAGIGEIQTLSIPTIWVTTQNMQDGLAYDLLRALWHEQNQGRYQSSHPAAKDITYGSSFEGVKTPLHKGAIIFHEQVEAFKQRRIYALDRPKPSGFSFSFGAHANN